MSSLQIGDIQVTHIDGGRFRLDGGAMFGVVPRPVWEPLCPTDDRNRIPMACNCLLLRCAGEYLLVETGCGDRFNAKERDIFAIGPGPGLVDNLRAAGVESDEVSHVVLTHLHFDHAAGSLAAAEDGSLRPAFANAVYWVQRREFEDALSGHSIMRTSYAAADLKRLAGSGRVRFLDGDSGITAGVRTCLTGGHTAAHQAVVVEDAGQTLLYPGDLIPTRHHLSPYWIMAYDMHPHDTLREKKRWIDAACSGGWIVAWDHDPDSPWSTLRRDGKRVVPEAAF